MSGLLPLTDLASLSTAYATTCIKPGQGLFNTTISVRDSMVGCSVQDMKGDVAAGNCLQQHQQRHNNSQMALILRLSCVVCVVRAPAV